MARRRTSPSATTTSDPKLSEVARHVKLPPGIVDTGWPAVRDQIAAFGDTFDRWQDGLGRVMLGKRADGMYAATVGGITLSIPRQVAKTFIVGRIVVALCVLFPGLRVLWTAHRGRTSTMTFRNLQSFVRRKKVKPYIASIRTANGEQEIVFANGSIIMFGAREHGFGRGFDQIDVEVFDEAQILTEKALEDMVAATNQSRHPHGALLFYMGTPPRPTDPGEAFTLRRERALSGKAKDAVYVECSADPDADPDDRAQWRKANPSFPRRTPLQSMLRLRENLPSDEAWLREALGIWDQVHTGGVIPFDAWKAHKDEESIPVDRFALGVEAGPDLVSASVVLAGQREDGNWHVELDDHREGAAWLDAYLAELVRLNPQIRTVVVDVGGPIRALLEEHRGGWRFRGSKMRVTPVRVAELGAACSRVLDGTVTGWLHHIDQVQMNIAVQSAGKRMLGDSGMWVFSRKTATSDITPIQAAALALHGAQHSKVTRSAPPATDTDDGSVVVL